MSWLMILFIILDNSGIGIYNMELEKTTSKVSRRHQILKRSSQSFF